MKEQEYLIDGVEGHKIYVVSWKPEGEIKGVLQIVHGMSEYCRRYKDFAEYLNKQGIAVYAHDHRGHGKSVGENETRGYFDAKDGFMKVVDETHIVTEFIKENEKDKQILIFGHSMGSFVTRKYIQLYDKDIVGAIISGTGDSKGVVGALGKLIAKTISKVKGEKYESKLLDKLSFGSFNSNFKPNRTVSDWLSRDEEQVDKYIADEGCGFMCTAKFYVDLMTGIEMVSNKDNIAKTRQDLPILFVSGEKDPVGNMGKEIESVYNKYKDLSLDVEMKLFKDARHEILNEINKDEVYKYLFEWMKNFY
ncbi:lysophospholipase [Clostridium sp. DL1XJH146]